MNKKNPKKDCLYTRLNKEITAVLSGKKQKVRYATLFDGILTKYCVP